MIDIPSTRRAKCLLNGAVWEYEENVVVLSRLDSNFVFLFGPSSPVLKTHKADFLYLIQAISHYSDASRIKFCSHKPAPAWIRKGQILRLRLFRFGLFKLTTPTLVSPSHDERSTLTSKNKKQIIHGMTNLGNMMLRRQIRNNPKPVPSPKASDPPPDQLILVSIH